MRDRDPQWAEENWAQQTAIRARLAAGCAREADLRQLVWLQQEMEAHLRDGGCRPLAWDQPATTPLVVGSRVSLVAERGGRRYAGRVTAVTRKHVFVLSAYAWLARAFDRATGLAVRAPLRLSWEDAQRAARAAIDLRATPGLPAYRADPYGSARAQRGNRQGSAERSGSRKDGGR